MRRPLGCLTGASLLAVGLATAVIVAVALLTGNGIFSPGRLGAQTGTGPVGGVASHAELEARCDACHPNPLAGTTMSDLCLRCHTAVGQEIASRSGLHGPFPGATGCRACHTDHRGAAASLTVTDPSRFPHEQTGFALAAHRTGAPGGTLACVDCHTASLASFSVATCLACHRTREADRMAPHVAAFGPACLACHDGVDRYPASFKHDAWALTGGHVTAACTSCHPGATDPASLRSAPTTCVSCHADRDIHEGRLGTTCGDCHSSAAWTEATIDHGKTRFPLVGRHVAAVCLDCHVDRHWTGIGTTCRACHEQVDPHGTQFPGDCAACHAPSRWNDVTFDHATLGFPLTGLHAGVACTSCHVAGVFKGTATTCVACHRGVDPHTGSLGTNCAACHTTAGWAATTFDHATSAFPLTGAHTSVSCAACHPGGRFAGTSTTCVSCHSSVDPHHGSFGTDCAACHSTSTWSGASFDHSKSVFPLTGAHSGVACAACHPNGRFAGTPTTCVACHLGVDAHHGAYGTDCAACHSTSTWSGATVDHSKFAFPLTGAHASVACLSCHPGGLYKGTPTACSACHAKPASHGSSTSNTCSLCHSTTAWTPATFNGTHTFPRNHGGASTCATCHPSTWLSYSCAACHSNSSMTSRHQGISGFSLTTCASCHPTGGGGD